MNDRKHHIRLLAGLEAASAPSGRLLDREQTSELADHLAADLARTVPGVDTGLLVVAGALFEANEVITPGFPAWQALNELAGRMSSVHGPGTGVLAIGAHHQRLPDDRLNPSAQQPAGQFLVLPMVLVVSDEHAEALEERLETELFERASIDPPARAVLARSLGLETIHGQLLTLHDLIALQHVQFDSAGLGAFWPLVEHTLLDPKNSCGMDLPGKLKAKWLSDQGRIVIDFRTWDQSDDPEQEYALWLRSFRSLTALLDAHSIDWAARPEPPTVLDEHGDMMIETSGHAELSDALTAHHHPDLGLVAWTLIEDGRVVNLYPLRPDAAARIERDFARRGLTTVHHCDTPCTDQSGRLTPETST